jgi:Putative intracellular protease/amidase
VKNALILLAHGFEETEAFVPFDVLNRSGEVKAVLCGLEGTRVISSRGARVECGLGFEDVNLADYDAIVLPGGLKAAKRLSSSWPFLEALIGNFSRLSVLSFSAVTAFVLAPSMLLEGRCATAIGSVATLSPFSFENDEVTIDGNLITARSALSAFDASFALLEMLSGPECATSVKAVLN